MIGRCFDLLAGVFLLTVGSPILALAALGTKAFMGSPVLFRQERLGLWGIPFVAYKFRTMSEERDSEGALLPDGMRMHWWGEFLRGSSLDELPQLYNVLRGEMSLAGPRPLLPQYWERYTDFQRRRHAVKPGITGWAQVNGRNSLSWEERFELDVWYVDNKSLWLDIRIIWLTLLKVLRRDGISQQGHATMSEFRGTNPE